MCECHAVSAARSTGNAKSSEPSEHCLGIIIPIPDPLASRLEEWRASFGDPMAAVVPPHITLITTTPASDWLAVLAHVRDAASRQEEFQVTLRGTGTFRPQSPVVYINVAEGFDACVNLHERLQSGPLARPLDFPFHPHVTVAHDVSEASMDTALRQLIDFEETFPVHSMGLFEHEESGIWKLREELEFGRQDSKPG